MGRRYDTVSLLTDYGLDDEFVGVVKAVIRDLAPHVTVIDLTHGIRPYDVRAGSLALARAIPYVPGRRARRSSTRASAPSRRAIAVEVAGGAGVLVGPDNGLLGPAVGVLDGADRAVELTNAAFHLVSAGGATFAGRDVFAPVVAHLCNGVDLAELGAAVDPALLVPGLVPLPRHEADGFHAEVLWVDRFGNCQLNVGPAELAALTDDDVVAVRRWATSVVPPGWCATFADLGPGSLGLVLDSHGMYALVLDQRSAAAELALAQGDAVRIVTVDGSAAPSPAVGVAAPTLRRSGPGGAEHR